MIFSLVIAFVVSPGRRCSSSARRRTSPRLDATGLHPADPERDAPEPERDAADAHPETAPEGALARLDRRVIRGCSARRRCALALRSPAVVVLLAGAVALLVTGVVKVKMLPFDNKREFQVQLDLPAGTAREEALALGQRGRAPAARRARRWRDVQVHSGVAAPFTFVGMVRHSFLREAPEQVDLQVNLLAEGRPRRVEPRRSRSGSGRRSSALARPRGARLKVVEIPPGPPVLATLVAEIYGPTAAERDRIAGEVREAFRAVPGRRGRRLDARTRPPRSSSLAVDREKAALHGVAAGARRPDARRRRARRASSARSTSSAAPRQVPLVLQLAPAQRARLDTLLSLTVPGARGQVPLSELVRAEETREAAEIQHKNLKPVVVRHRRAGRRDREPALRAPRAREEARGPARRRRRGRSRATASRTRRRPSAPRSSGTASGTSRSRSSATSGSPSRR